MTPEAFLTELWGASPPGCIQLWDGGTKRSRYVNGPDAFLPGEHPVDLYTGVALAHHDLGPTRRAKATEAAAIAGMWLDLDIEPGKCPDMNTAMQLAMSFAEPTTIVGSGGGIHCWYLLEGGPFPIRTDATRTKVQVLADAWNAAHGERAKADGIHVDRTHDLARLLRLPGTLNGKTEPYRPVEALVTDGPRHTLAGLNALVRGHVPAAQLRLQRASSVAPLGGVASTFRLDRQPAIDPARFADLASIVPEFAATWARKRSFADDSQSTYDQSLAHWALEAEWSDQETVDLMRQHRLAHRPGDPKAARADYYQRTLSKAKVGVQKAADHADQQERRNEIKRLIGGEAA